MTLHEDARRHGVSVRPHSGPTRTALRASRPAVSTSPTAMGEPVLFGRDRELDILRDFITSIDRGGSALLVMGELGAGRSRLLDVAADIARSSGLLVLSTGGYRSESHIRFAALHKLLLPLTDAVAALPRRARLALLVALGMETGAEPDQLRLFDAVSEVLRTTATLQPILITVDDLDEIDDASLEVLAFVARRLGDASIRLLAAAKSTTRFGAGFGFGMELLLQRLSAEASAQLVDTIAPDLPHSVRKRVVDEGAGNSLALVEFARGSRNALEADPEASPAVLPSYGDQNFAFEVAELAADSRRALLLLALDGSGELAPLTLAGLSLEVLLPAENAGLVILNRQRLSAEFGHPLVRSAVVAASNSSERRQAHYVLAAQQSDVEKQAFHLSEASDRADEATAALLERAGAVALGRGDTDAAMRSLARAAVLSPSPLDRQRRLARAAFVATDVAGDRVMATRLLTESRQVRGGAGSLYTAIAFALDQFIVAGDVAAAFRILRNAIEFGDHGWAADDDQLIEAMNTWMLVCWSAGREDYWRTFFDAMSLLRPAPPEALRTLGIAFADTVRATETERDAVIRMFSEVNGKSDSALTLHLSTAALFLDLLHLGTDALWRLIDQGRRAGPTFTLLRALGQMCLYDFGAGRWDEADALADEGMAVATAADAEQFSAMFMYVKGLLAGVRGQTALTETWIAQVDAITGLVEARGIRRFGTHARVLAAEGAADWERAYREAATLSAPGEFAPYMPMALWVAYDLVEAAMRTGRTDEAQAHHRAMVTEGLPGLSPRHALLTAGAGALIAGPEDWRAAFERALAVEDADEWPFDYARVQLAFGARLRKERRTADARQQLHAALTVFERLGAEPWAARAREELRIAREPVERGGLDLELTPQELVVAELAAAGLSNRQIGERMFLSTRTVSGHLYRIFPKLGIAHRSALRDALQKARE